MTDTETQLSLTRDYIASVQNGDVRRFDQILAEDFYCSNPDGTLIDRAAFLEQTARPVTIKDLSAQDVMIRVFGDTPANVSGKLLKQWAAWYRDAIVFANPPMLDLSQLVKFTAQESFEGYNLRFAQQWDSNNDLLPARIDTISGETLIYPELAVRGIHSPTG